MGKDSLLINMDDANAKRQLQIAIGVMRGPHEVLIKPVKRTRSLDQNAYYWVAVVQPFTEWLRDVWGDSKIDREQAHEILKVKILGMEEKQIPDSDKSLPIIPHSKFLSVEEFAEYIEKCAAWLAEFCNVVVLSSELFYEADTLGKKRGKGLVADHK